MASGRRGKSAPKGFAHDASRESREDSCIGGAVKKTFDESSKDPECRSREAQHRATDARSPPLATAMGAAMTEQQNPPLRARLQSNVARE